MYVTYAVAPKTFKALPTGGTHTTCVPPHLLYSLLSMLVRAPCEGDTQLFPILDGQ